MQVSHQGMKFGTEFLMKSRAVESIRGPLERGGQGGNRHNPPPPPHCVFKWILRGHLKPTPNAIISIMFEVISIKVW